MCLYLHSERESFSFIGSEGTCLKEICALQIYTSCASVRRSCACPLVVSLCLCIMHPHQCQRACLPYMGWLPLRGLRLAVEGRLFCLWAVFPSISGFLFRAPCPSHSTLSSCSLARGNTTDTLKTLAQTFLRRSHRGLFRAHSRASLPRWYIHTAVYGGRVLCQSTWSLLQGAKSHFSCLAT